MPAGRPKFEVTDEVLRKVEKYAGLGLTEEQIAINLGVSYSTLRAKKRGYSTFLSAIERGRAKAIALVSNAGFEKAMDGNADLIKFFLKNRAPEQWEETSKRVVSEGQPNSKRKFSDFYSDDDDDE